MEVYSAEETYLDAGIQEAPQYYLFHFKKGNLLLARGENQSAIEAYSKALELSTSKPEIYNNRANAYVATGKKEEAIRDYSEALKKSGDDPRVLLQRCRAYSRFDDLENALKDLTVLEQCCMYLVDPEFSNRLKKRWRLKVIEELSAQIANDPRNGLLYVNRAKYYLDNRMGHEALADLKTATDLEPHNKDFKRYYEELASSFKP